MKKKILPYIVCLCLGFPLFAEKPSKEKEAENAKLNMHLFRSNYESSHEFLKGYLNTGNLESGELEALYSTFKAYSVHPYIPEAAGIPKEFLAKTAEYLRVLTQMMYEIERAEETKDYSYPRYIAAKKKLKPTLEEFKKYFDNPPKLKGPKKRN
ncbi:MAG TPA: hypothetical protein PK821_06770 [Victivallales bacterium]|nr:hypothetical protein [Victivallales bacterium]